MSGRAAYGTKMYKMSGTTSTAIAAVTTFSGPGQEGDDIDVTDHDDAEGYREFVPGLVDAGEVELELNYTAAGHAILVGLIRSTASYKIVYPDSANWTFAGYCKAVEGPEADVEDKLSATATFKISGKPTFATN